MTALQSMTALAPYPQLTDAQPCRAPGADPDDWFSEDPLVIDSARAACRACPIRIREACLAYALDHALDDDHAGVWAGLTPAERRSLRRRYILKEDK